SSTRPSATGSEAPCEFLFRREEKENCSSNDALLRLSASLFFSHANLIVAQLRVGRGERQRRPLRAAQQSAPDRGVARDSHGRRCRRRRRGRGGGIELGPKQEAESVA